MAGFKDLLDKLRKKKDVKPIPPEDIDKLVDFALDMLLKALKGQEEKIVDALESHGLTEAQAKELYAKAIAKLSEMINTPPAA